VARTTLDRPDRTVELERLFGEPVQVIVLIEALDGETILARSREVGADAIAVDTAARTLEDELRAHASNMTVLRPLRELQHTHRGDAVERFVGYGLLRPSGDIGPLPDSSRHKRPDSTD
jgi:hypothetical protein